MTGQDEESYDLVYPASSDSDKSVVMPAAMNSYAVMQQSALSLAPNLRSYGLLSGKRQSQEVQRPAEFLAKMSVLSENFASFLQVTAADLGPQIHILADQFKADIGAIVSSEACDRFVDETYAELHVLRYYKQQSENAKSQGTQLSFPQDSVQINFALQSVVSSSDDASMTSQASHHAASVFASSAYSEHLQTERSGSSLHTELVFPQVGGNHGSTLMQHSATQTASIFQAQPATDLMTRYPKLLREFLSTQKLYFRKLHDTERAIQSYIKMFPCRYTASYHYHQFRDSHEAEITEYLKHLFFIPDPQSPFLQPVNDLLAENRNTLTQLSYFAQPKGPRLPHFSGDRRLDAQLRQIMSNFTGSVNGLRRQADELTTDAQRSLDSTRGREIFEDHRCKLYQKVFMCVTCAQIRVRSTLNQYFARQRIDWLKRGNRDAHYFIRMKDEQNELATQFALSLELQAYRALNDFDVMDYKQYILDQVRIVRDQNRLLDGGSFMGKALGRWRLQKTPLMFPRHVWDPVYCEYKQATTGPVALSFGAGNYMREVAQRQGQQPFANLALNSPNHVNGISRVLKEKREFKDQNARSRQQPLQPHDGIFPDSLDDEDKENQNLRGYHDLPNLGQNSLESTDAIIKSAESAFDCLFEPINGHPAPAFGSDLALMSLPGPSGEAAITAEQVHLLVDESEFPPSRKSQIALIASEKMIS